MSEAVEALERLMARLEADGSGVRSRLRPSPDRGHTTARGGGGLALFHRAGSAAAPCNVGLQRPE